MHSRLLHTILHTFWTTSQASITLKKFECTVAGNTSENVTKRIAVVFQNHLSPWKQQCVLQPRRISCGACFSTVHFCAICSAWAVGTAVPICAPYVHVFDESTFWDRLFPIIFAKPTNYKNTPLRTTHFCSHTRTLSENMFLQSN